MSNDKNARYPGSRSRGRKNSRPGKQAVKRNNKTAVSNIIRLSGVGGSEKSPRRFLRNNRQKLTWAFVVMVGLMVALMVRLSYINATSGDKYQKQVLSQLNYNSSIIPYRRGDITDRNGVVLATSEKVYNLIIDPYVMTHSKVKTEGDCVGPTLDALETYFGLDKGDVREVVESDTDNRYRVMKRQLTYAELQPYYELINSGEDKDKEVSKYIKGIWFEDDYLRRYPYNTLACDVLGFTVSGNVGTYGIEQYYNETLNGTDGREYGYLTEETNLERTTISPVNGRNVRSTIDVNIQRIVENVIWEFNEAIGSRNTSVIVMDPDNGEILAMASYPIFDLNNPRDLSGYYTKEQIGEMSPGVLMNTYNYLWRNFSITDAYEPGSTAKPMTVAAALEENTVTPLDTFYCSGVEYFQDGSSQVPVGCNATHAQLDLAGSLMHSCNVAMMKIVAGLGKETFINYQELFNLGQMTGIDLPGEASAKTLLYYEDNMGPVEMATNSFGQGYSATAIQMVSAFCSIINGGNYYRPHIVKEISTESGSIVESMDAELMRTTISEETSRWMRQVLRDTVVSGSARPVEIAGYTIAGKTGTSEKKPISEKKMIVSLMSCAPADDPEVVLYVVIDEPQVANQAQSGLASHMSKRIYEEMLPYLQIFSEYDQSYEEVQETAETETETETETQSETESESEDAQSDSEEETDENTDESAERVPEKETKVWKTLTEQQKRDVIYEYAAGLTLDTSKSDLIDYASNRKAVEEAEEKAREESEAAAENEAAAESEDLSESDTEDENKDTDETKESADGETDTEKTEDSEQDALHNPE